MKYTYWLSLPDWSPRRLPESYHLLMFTSNIYPVTDQWSLTPYWSTSLLPSRNLVNTQLHSAPSDQPVTSHTRPVSQYAASYKTFTSGTANAISCCNRLRGDTYTQTGETTSQPTVTQSVTGTNDNTMSSGAGATAFPH